MFTVGQQLAFAFKDKKLLLLVIKDIEGKILNHNKKCNVFCLFLYLF